MWQETETARAAGGEVQEVTAGDGEAALGGWGSSAGPLQALGHLLLA